MIAFALSVFAFLFLAGLVIVAAIIGGALLVSIPRRAWRTLGVLAAVIIAWAWCGAISPDGFLASLACAAVIGLVIFVGVRLERWGERRLERRRRELGYEEQVPWPHGVPLDDQGRPYSTPGGPSP